MLTERGESVFFIFGRIIHEVVHGCETQSDWMTHIFDPAARRLAADLAVTIANVLGCR